LTILRLFFPASVSGNRNRQMIPAEKETEMYSDFENFEDDDVIAAVLAFRLLKKFKRKAA